METTEMTSGSTEVHTEERIRDEKLKEQAYELARQAEEAFEEGNKEESRSLFEASLAVNKERTDRYRFQQAVELFLAYRSHHRLQAGIAIEDIVMNRYKEDSFEHLTFARALLLHGLSKDDAPLITVAEEMLDDDYIVVSTILEAAQADSTEATIGDLRRASMIIRNMTTDQVNEHFVDRTHKRVEEAIRAKQRDC